MVLWRFHRNLFLFCYLFVDLCWEWRSGIHSFFSLLLLFYLTCSIFSVIEMVLMGLLCVVVFC